MKMLKSWALGLVLALTLTISFAANAQNNEAETSVVEANAASNDVEMADQLRKDGKIYVVVGCVLVVLAGMIFYLISIDKKVSRLEKQHQG